MVENVRSKVIEIIAEQALLDVSDVSADMSMDDLGIDSLGLVEAIFSIEEAFDVKVPFNANAPDRTEFDISTVGSVIRSVESLLAAGQ